MIIFSCFAKSPQRINLNNCGRSESRPVAVAVDTPCLPSTPKRVELRLLRSLSFIVFFSAYYLNASAQLTTQQITEQFKIEFSGSKKDKFQITTKNLDATEGIIVEVAPGANAELAWSFGAATPEAIENNLFSVEGNAFTLYYGESMNLHTLQGLVPLESKIDEKTSPLQGKLSVEAGKKYYFCIYRQNAKADYNCFMLKELFYSSVGRSVNVASSGDSDSHSAIVPKPPIMGWSSWNNFRVNIDEKMIREQADAMISSGMYEAGYRFINIDDGYFGGRDADGNLLCNSLKFPSGMEALARYIHAKGLKAGIYTDAGSNTCGSIYDKDSLGMGVGIFGHIAQDCRRFFTEWKYDFLKVDWCGGERQKLDEETEYLKILSEVRKANPNAIFNICRWKFPGEWAIDKADSWRISGDIRATFSSILKIIDLSAGIHKYASAGHYNDMDMLQVGRGMTYDEDKTHFSMWCMLNSPLLAGNDLRTMSKETIEMLTNGEIIALNQDRLFRQAQPIFKENGIEIWEKPLFDGSRAYAIMNRNDEEVDFEFAANKLNINSESMIRDLWKHENLGKAGNIKTFSLPKHGIVVFKTKFAASDNRGIYNVKDFGATGDGQTIDSHAINKAVEAAAANGGGTVYVPAGNYLSYSIRLKSHIRLFLDAGATITAAFPSATKGYDEAEPNPDSRYQDFGHSHWKNSLLWAIGEEDITICGSGTICGMGLTREESRLKGVGNKAVSLKECKNITLKDIKMLHCGHFALLATGVENMTIDKLLIDTNRDGLDIDCCRNVRISNCTVNSPWDDAIVLKASYGLGYFKDTENVTVTNCMVSGYDRGTVANGSYQRNEPQAPDHGFNCGRIKFGTESSGGFKNITISNCVFDRCRGLALETVDGGDLEDITISNITMRDIVNAPFFLRLGARMRSPGDTPVGKMRRILIDNINVFNADSRYASIISGIPEHRIENVTVSNIRIHYKGGYPAAAAGLTPPENEKLYPEPWMFGAIPASVFFVRHAKNIRFRNLDVTFEKDDFRPPFVMDDTLNISIKDANIALPANSLPGWTKTVGAQTYPANKNSVKASAFGAKGDGTTLNTQAIQKAINHCAGRGGGRVELDYGVYLTGALFLKSNVELHIGKGVTLKAINRLEDFPDKPTRVAGIEMLWPSAILNVINQQNVAITGDGVIDGDGKYLWDRYWEMRKDYDKKGLRWIVDYDCKRVRSLLVSESSDVTVSDLTFLRAGFWTIQLLYSSHCTVKGVTIRNNVGGRGPSTDGIDVDSSSHVLIDGCNIDCNDDNICLKAGRDADGLRVNRPTEYVFIRNCIARKGAGLMTCGSETSGGIRNIYCTESQALGTSAALRIKSAVTRGGTVENIYMNNVKTDSVNYILNCDMNWNPSYSYSELPAEYENKNLPTHWNVMLQKVAPEQGIPRFRNIYLSDIQANNTETFVHCVGMEQSVIQNVELKNMDVQALKAGTVRYTDNFRLENVNYLLQNLIENQRDIK